MSSIWIAAFAALCTVVVVLALIVLGTLRRLLPVIEQAEAALAARTSHGGLERGALVPAFAADEIRGSVFTEADLEGERSVVLFLSPSCKACEGLVADLKAGSVPDLGAPLVVLSDDRRQADEFVVTPAVTVVVQNERSVADVFDSNVTPHAFVIGARREVEASGITSDWKSLRRLLEEVPTEGGDNSEMAAAAVGT